METISFESELERPAAERRKMTYANTVVARGYRISWGAVWAGVVMGIAVQGPLSILGLAWGARMFEPVPGAQSASNFGFNAGLWLVGSIFIASYISGWFAGRMAGYPARSDGALHGLVNWGVSIVCGLGLLTIGLSGWLAGNQAMLHRMSRAAKSIGIPASVTGPIKNELTERGLGIDTTPNESVGNVPAENHASDRQAQDSGQNPSAEKLGRQPGQTMRDIANAGFVIFALLLASALLAAWGGAVGAGRLLEFKTVRL